MKRGTERLEFLRMGLDQYARSGLTIRAYCNQARQSKIGKKLLEKFSGSH
jgi:hypothetical protein